MYKAGFHLVAGQSVSRKFGAEEDFPLPLGGLFRCFPVCGAITTETVSEVSRLLIFHSYKLQKWLPDVWLCVCQAALLLARVSRRWHG